MYLAAGLDGIRHKMSPGDPDDEASTRTVRPYGDGLGNGWGPPFDPFTKGKGQAKGKAKGWRSPHEPE